MKDEQKEKIDLFQKLVAFLKKEGSDYSLLHLSRNEEEWSYSIFSEKGEKLGSKKLPEKYHKIFYGLARMKQPVLEEEIDE